MPALHFLCFRVIFFLILITPILSFAAAKYDPSVTRPWQMVRGTITIIDKETGYPIKIAVSYGIPTPQSGTVEKLPVIVESLPYRKDDSMYPVRNNEMNYFASRGFIYAHVDIRGTGGSEGVRLPYEYSDIEIDDTIQVIQKLGNMEWNLGGGKKVKSNGSVGLWGNSWSACNAFVVAGMKARDPRLEALKTIIPIHCATNLYEGDVHYYDGIMHQDEYILSVDHENAIPSYGFNGAASMNTFKIDNDFINNRWTASPWSFFYLGKQVKNNFWTKRTAFFYGPFNNNNPDDFAVPVFAIGSLLDGYRDAPVEIYEKLKAKGVPVKFAMSPSTHSLMDYASPGPVWEWRNEASKWFYYWLVDNEDGSISNNDKSLINQNEFAIYIRTPGSDKNNVKGYWRNMNWPQTDAPTKLYLTSDHTLTATCPAPNQSTIHSLNYKPDVGVEMQAWYGESNYTLGDMGSLDADSLVYDLEMDKRTQLVGSPEITLRVAAESKEQLQSILAHWHVRLEDVDPDGLGAGLPSVAHVTGASINGAYRDEGASPSYLKSGKYYTIKLKLHFTTWTFKKGHKLRIAITNAMFRMMWPSPNKMITYLKVSDENSFVSLPLKDSEPEPTPAHQYASETNAVYTEPADGWYFAEGGYPREYTIKNVNGRRVVTWKSDYYSNIAGWLISVELDHEFSQSKTNPADTVWTGYARQIYQWVGVTDPTLWGKQFGYPAYLKPGPNVPAPLRTFKLETYLEIKSDADQFHATLSRTLKDENNGDLVPPFSIRKDFDRQYQ